MHHFFAKRNWMKLEGVTKCVTVRYLEGKDPKLVMKNCHVINCRPLKCKILNGKMV